MANLVFHVILRDAFGAEVAKGTLVSTGAADPGQLKEWLGSRDSFPLLHSTPNPVFPLELVVADAVAGDD